MRVIKWVMLSLFISHNALAADSFLDRMLAERQGQNPVSETRVAPQGKDAFSKTHGLILFFSSQCPYCRQFSPVVKQFAEASGMEILPLSFDNQPLPEFQKFLPATKEWVSVAFGNNPINYPALFMVNAKTHTLYPVSTGALSEAELASRVEALIDKVKAYEEREGQ